MSLPESPSAGSEIGNARIQLPAGRASSRRRSRKPAPPQRNGLAWKHLDSVRADESDPAAADNFIAFWFGNPDAESEMRPVESATPAFSSAETSTAKSAAAAATTTATAAATRGKAAGSAEAATAAATTAAATWGKASRPAETGTRANGRRRSGNAERCHSNQCNHGLSKHLDLPLKVCREAPFWLSSRRPIRFSEAMSATALVLDQCGLVIAEGARDVARHS